MLDVLEFKKRGNPHVHSFLWMSNASNVENEAAYMEFIKKTMNG